MVRELGGQELGWEEGGGEEEGREQGEEGKEGKEEEGGEGEEGVEGGEGQEEVVMVKVGVVSPTAVVVMVYVWKVRVCVLQGHCRERPSSKSAF